MEERVGPERNASNENNHTIWRISDCPRFRESETPKCTSFTEKTYCRQVGFFPPSELPILTVAGSDDTLSILARELAQVLGRVVLNQTGLSGRYDLTLRWTPDDAPPPMLNGAPDPSEPPGIFTAIQEQLGLKLESSRGPVPVLVIDSVAMPSAN